MAATVPDPTTEGTTARVEITVRRSGSDPGDIQTRMHVEAVVHNATAYGKPWNPDPESGILADLPLSVLSQQNKDNLAAAVIALLQAYKQKNDQP